jgi:hypothetical protein
MGKLLCERRIINQSIRYTYMISYTDQYQRREQRRMIIGGIGERRRDEI